MMARITTREEAFKLCQDCISGMRMLDIQFPGEGAFESVIKQLEFVAPILAAEGAIMPRYDKLNFGFLGMKFVREFDEALSAKLASLDCFIEDNFQRG